MMAIVYETAYGNLTLAELVAVDRPMIFQVGVRWYHARDIPHEAAVPIIKMESIEFDDNHPGFPALRLRAKDGETTPWYDQREWEWFAPDGR